MFNLKSTSGKLSEQYSNNPRPLGKMTVVAIVAHVSGTTAASELAKQGATVFKIELEEGDPARSYLDEATYSQLNTGVLSVVKQQPLYEKMLEKADVIIDNRSPQAKDKDQILKDHLLKVDHHQIYASISGFGDHIKQSSMDVTVQAASGISYTNAYDSKQPLKVGYVVADINTGKTAAFHIMSTWIGIQFQPEKYPQKLVRLDISLIGELLNQQAGQVIQDIDRQHKHIPEAFRTGNQDMFLSPFSFYPTKDNKFIAIAVATLSQFRKLCQLLGKDEWLLKYPNNQSRLASNSFEKELLACIREKPAKEWVKILSQEGIPTSQVNTLREAINSDYAKPYIDQHRKTGLTVVKSACQNSAVKISPECTLTTAKLNQHEQQASEWVIKDYRVSPYVAKL